jgi:hypothetical protein
LPLRGLTTTPFGPSVTPTSAHERARAAALNGSGILAVNNVRVEWTWPRSV